MIIASASNHSTWFPVLHEGLNFHTWQQYTTTGYAEGLYVAWVHQPSALGCSHFIITAAVPILTPSTPVLTPELTRVVRMKEFIKCVYQAIAPSMIA